MSIVSPHDRMSELNSGQLQSERGSQRRHQFDDFIDARIDESCRALWRAELIRRLLALLLGFNALALCWLVLDQWIYSPGPIFRSIAFLATTALAATYVWQRLLPVLRSSVDPAYAAKALEQDLPNSRQSILSYLTLREQSTNDHLQSNVLRSLGAESGKQLRQHDSLPSEALGTVNWWIAAIASLAILVTYVLASPKSSVQAMLRLGAPLADIAAPQRVQIEQILPGNAEVTAGQEVDISAHILGAYADELITCQWNSAEGQQTLNLSYDSAVDRYVGTLRIPYTAIGSIDYQITAGDAKAGPFKLSVRDIPVVAIDRVEYETPAYTKLGSFSNSVGVIRAIEGTNVVVHAKVNRSIQRAKIEFNPDLVGDRIQATAGVQEMEIDSSGTQLVTKFKLRSFSEGTGLQTKSAYRILVWDDINQQNIDPIVYPIEIINDLPPEINITIPSQSPKDLPINAQQLVELHASDPDFGLSKIELEIRYGNNRKLVPVLWESIDGKLGRQVVSIPIRPEELKLRIGDTVELIGIASDNRSGGEGDPLQANVVRTDSAVLKITSPSTLPSADDPTADGVSTPDPKQATDSTTASQEDQSSDGAGSGGSGGAETTSTQQGENQGDTGSSSSSMPNESENSSNDSSGSGSAESNDNQSGNKTSDTDGNSRANPSNGPEQENAGNASPPDGEMSDSESNGDQEAGNSATDQPTGNSQSDSGAESSDVKSNHTNQPNSNGPSQDHSNSGDSNSDANSSEDIEPDDHRDAQSGSNAEDHSTDSNQARSQENGKEAGGNSVDNQMDQSGSNTNSAVNPNTKQPTPGQRNKPGHDGEAFERIREFMDQQQESANQSQTGGSSSENDLKSQNQSSSSGESGSQDQNDNPENRNSTQDTESSPDSQDDKQDDSGSKGQGESENTSKPSADPQGSGESPPQGSPETNAADNQETSDDPGKGESDSSSNPLGNEKVSEAAASQDGAANAESAGNPTNQSEASGENAQDPQDQDSQPSEETGVENNQTANTNSGNDPSADLTAKPESETSSEQSDASPSNGDEIFGDGSLENLQPPDEVNVDYAKRATDLVLDYLEQNRDQPNQDLLDQLQWSEEELRSFVDRWNRIRELPKTDGESGNEELIETLRSLGLKDPSATSSKTKETTDSLRSIKDSGYSPPVPAAYRDAFNAFRRAMNRSSQ